MGAGASRNAPLLHVLAAVDRNVGAGYECGLFTCQIRDEPGHFFRRAKPPHGYLRDDLGLQDFFRNRSHHIRTYVTRRDGIDGDTLACHFESQRFGSARGTAVAAPLDRRNMGGQTDPQAKLGSEF